MINQINIAVDLDGVTCNFVKIFSEHANKLFGDRCYIINDVSKVKDWHWEKWYPITEKEVFFVWDDIRKTKDFWTKLEVYNLQQWEYFTEKINFHKNINVYFLTSREQTKGSTVARQSAEWLIKNGIKYPFVIETHQKEKFIENLNIKFFIDDRAENLISVKNYNPSCIVYAQDAPYNQEKLVIANIDHIKTNGLRKFIDSVIEYTMKKQYEIDWKKT